MEFKLRRRGVLQGIGGITLGLPFLETFAPRIARAAAPPKRLAIFYCCNGVLANKWYPTTPFGALTAESRAAHLQDHGCARHSRRTARPRQPHRRRRHLPGRVGARR
jgi:hypothetical protein